jgi:hypothetical protein
MMVAMGGPMMVAKSASGGSHERGQRQFSPSCPIPNFVPLLPASLVEGEKQDAVRGHEATVDRVRGPGDHHRGLARAGPGEDLDPVVEAHHRPCLLLGQGGSSQWCRRTTDGRQARQG